VDSEETKTLLESPEFKVAVARAIASATRPPQDTQGDQVQPACVEFAKMYDSSWNKLRDWEWRCAFALWAGIAIATGLLSGTLKQFLGMSVEYSAPSSFAFWLCLLVLYACVLVVTGSVAVLFQNFYQYLDERRAYFVRRALGEDSKQTDSTGDWKIEVLFEKVPPEGRRVVLFHVIITSILLLLSIIVIATNRPTDSSVNRPIQIGPINVGPIRTGPISAPNGAD
jgi:hypothetical protein